MLQRLTAEQGIDSATRWLYEQVCSSPEHGSFIQRLDALRNSASPPDARRLDATLAIAPGAFYVEFPHTGADGRLLREEAEKLGCRTTLIPTHSMGTLAENAAVICEWLIAHGESADHPLILASVSKGGSDIKAALARPEAAEAFRHVRAWINLCGILDGSPMVNWVLDRPWQSLFYRSLFWWRGYDFEVIRQLRRGPQSPLDFQLRLPDHLRLINVIGFPQREHLTNRLSRLCHRRLAPLGPNDGGVLLNDVVQTPGQHYPVWGADHYLRPSWELRSLGAAILIYLGEELKLLDVRKTAGNLTDPDTRRASSLAPEERQSIARVVRPWLASHTNQ